MMGRPETTLSEVRSWQYRKLGRITQTVHGSHVDITVRLGRAANRLWSTVIVFGGIGLLYVAGRIIEAFLNGRATALLDAVTKAGR
jgi:hypothetical protein